MRGSLSLAALLAVLTAVSAAETKRTPKEALQAVQDLIGSWRGTGTPHGTREEKDRGFWQETISWQWQFKDKDVWLRADIDKGKHFTSFELRYLPAGDLYELKAVTPGKETLTFEGKIADKRLTMERTEAKTKVSHRLVFSLLHSNRHLYRCDTRAAGSTVYNQVYQVGATKLGVAFATEDKGIECIVSGGKGTMPVSFKGKTYYVCCSGCRDAFNEEPEKYIKEFEARKAEKKE